MKRDKGFTLIELVIVLAIAALIILVVLQAVGAAQKSNRDSTRKQEAARVVSLLEQYASNNGGKYPVDNASLTTAVTAYDSGLGAKYTVNTGTPANGTTANVLTGGCPVAPATVGSADYLIAYSSTTNNRDYSLSVCLEGGGISSVHPSN